MVTARGQGALGAAALLLAGGAVSGWVEAAVLGVGLAAAVAVGAAWMLRAPALDVRRELRPERVVRGRAAEGAVTFANPGRLASSPVVAVEHRGAAHPPVAIDVPRLAAGAATEPQVYPLPTDRRGVVDVGPVALTREDPLGLWRRTVEAGGTRRLWVHPRARALVGMPRGRTRSLEAAGTEHLPRGTAAFHALREYTVDDDLRFVHWRSSARVGQLLVRESVDPSQPRITLLVDDRAAAHDDAGFEEALDVAASVAAHAAGAGFPLRLRTASGRDASTGPVAAGLPRSGGGPAGPLLDVLAELEPCDDPLTAVVAPLLAEPRRDTLVAVSGAPGLDDVRAFGTLARRFHDTVIVLVGAGAATAAVPPALGARLLRGADADEVVGRWNRSVR